MPSITLNAARLQYEFFDDFLWHISPHLWTSLASEGTVAQDADDPAGVVTLTATNTDNNEVALVSTNELYIFASDKPFFAECRLQYSEANTNAANVAFGFADAMGANLLGDDGAGDAINSSGVLIFKVDGETTWRVACEINSTVKETVTDQTAGGSSYQRLGIKGRPVDGTSFEIEYFLDGQPMTDSTYHKPIQHRIAYASATDMDFGVYLKTGSATQEVVKVDYIGFTARR